LLEPVAAASPADADQEHADSQRNPQIAWVLGISHWKY